MANPNDLLIQHAGPSQPVPTRFQGNMPKQIQPVGPGQLLHPEQRAALQGRGNLPPHLSQAQGGGGNAAHRNMPENVPSALQNVAAKYGRNVQNYMQESHQPQQPYPVQHAPAPVVGTQPIQPTLNPMEMSILQGNNRAPQQGAYPQQQGYGQQYPQTQHYGNGYGQQYPQPQPQYQQPQPSPYQYPQTAQPQFQQPQGYGQPQGQFSAQEMRMMGHTDPAARFFELLNELQQLAPQISQQGGQMFEQRRARELHVALQEFLARGAAVRGIFQRR